MLHCEIVKKSILKLSHFYFLHAIAWVPFSRQWQITSGKKYAFKCTFYIHLFDKIIIYREEFKFYKNLYNVINSHINVDNKLIYCSI